MEEHGELRQLRLQKMVNYLIGSGCAKNQKDVAERLNVTPPSLNAALKSKSYPSLIYLHRVNDAYGKLFSLEWLSSGEGEMLKQDDQQAALSNSIIAPRTKNICRQYVQGYEERAYYSCFHRAFGRQPSVR